MRNFFGNTTIFLVAVGSMVAATFRRKDKVVERTAGGYPLLKGWTSSPEEAIVQRLSELKRAELPPIQAVLFCTTGSNPGEVLPLRRDIENMGPSIQNSIVVTPNQGNPEQNFQITLGKRPRLMAEAGKSFHVNGNEEREAELYDFDQISLLGNQYLLMDIPMVKEAR